MIKYKDIHDNKENSIDSERKKDPKETVGNRL